MTNPLVSVEWLHATIENEHIVILDASLKKVGDTSKENSVSIPSTRFFDIKNKFSNTNSDFPNTIPSAKQFEKECQKLGINNNSKVIIYDTIGIYSSPRAWWLFKTMGHNEVYVLNGGLPAWIRKGYKTVTKQPKEFKLGNFKASYNASNVKSYKQILNNISEEQFLLVDARSEGRFNGTTEEPRKSLQSGHIPNSINISYQTVLIDGMYKSNSALRTLFSKKNIDSKKVVFSCGSGITACIVMLAYVLIFENELCLYDGSWTEWATLQKLTKE